MAILGDRVAGQALTPELALGHLEELSSDLRAAVLVDSKGRLAASTDPDRGDRLCELARALFERAEAAAEEAPAQVEVTTTAGAVFAIRDARFTLAVVADRLALASLMFYDLRSVLARLEPRAA